MEDGKMGEGSEAVVSKSSGKGGRREEGEAVDLYRLRYPLSCWSVGKIGRMEDGKARERGAVRKDGELSESRITRRGVGASKGNRGCGREINLTSVGFHSVFGLSGRDGVSVSGVVRVSVLVEIRSTQPTW